MKRWSIALLAATLAVSGTVSVSSAAEPSAVQSADTAAYTANLQQFGIHNDGTHPVETTQGINQALLWAKTQGYTKLLLPTGTYLIDKDSHINMVGDMTFELDNQTVLQKETNGKERYITIYIGYGINNAKLKGGIYRGDKDTHDYSKKDTPYTAGTHESGFGILVEGAKGTVIDGVRAENYTGDGLAIGGSGGLLKDYYTASFVSGAFDAAGKPIADSAKIRTKTPIALDAKFPGEREFELSNSQGLALTFDVYYYKSDNTFLSSLKGAKARNILQIPSGASFAHIVYAKPAAKDYYVEAWKKIVSKNITVRYSEFAFNRRQGITVGGADQVLIHDNVLHDMKGVAPQSGIDLEGGFGENGHRNTNIKIANNDFYNNTSYDLILYDGWNAVVEGNRFGSKGVIGLAISPPFTGAIVRDNHFDGSRILAYHDATFTGNRMNDSYTYFEGPNITIDGMVFTDSILSITSKTAYGVTASNIRMINNKKQQNALSIWNKPIKMTNVTIEGETLLNTVVGGVEDGSVFTNLRLLNHSGASLPRGTYANCEFVSAPGNTRDLIATQSGTYAFSGCKIQSSGTGLLLENKATTYAITGSTFEMGGNGSAISVQAAKKVDLQNNIIQASNLTRTDVALVKINDYWKRTEQADVLAATIKANRITANTATIGISTLYAGLNAPAYTVNGNLLTNAKLQLKNNDVAGGNVLQ
ncbi:right-handed parallel beta-helix repeat-containing protein [Paenibacillus aurantiacus]|uniref:Right-handed parallel beta-helix repeat-containing protein n=1 Tax=Paenibacillus aurantiacus TaxID=1936118 RepID=A0ABV5KIJ8_9BACL